MTLGHEKIDVYRLSIGYVAWVYEKAKALDRKESRQHKTGLDRMAAMLSRLGGCRIREEHEVYGDDFDPDPDSDFDLDHEVCLSKAARSGPQRCFRNGHPGSLWFGCGSAALEPSFEGSIIFA